MGSHEGSANRYSDDVERPERSRELEIRRTTESDTVSIMAIHAEAFGGEQGLEIADLARGLLSDDTGMPVLSLVAVKEEEPVGHIVFTRARLTGAESVVSARILGPLAVLPDEQYQGVGGQLIEEGLRQLRESGVDLVFVLGHPEYYPRHGFVPAGDLGYEAPYPIPEKDAEAWMVQELHPGGAGTARGKVQCCEVMDQPQHWRE